MPACVQMHLHQESFLRGGSDVVFVSLQANAVVSEQPMLLFSSMALTADEEVDESAGLK